MNASEVMTFAEELLCTTILTGLVIAQKSESGPVRAAFIRVELLFLLVHRFEEVLVVFGFSESLEQEFHGFHGTHFGEHLAK